MTISSCSAYCLFPDLDARLTQHWHGRWCDAESDARASRNYWTCVCTRRRMIRLVVTSPCPSSQLWRPRDSKRHPCAPDPFIKHSDLFWRRGMARMALGYCRHEGLEFISCELNWVHSMQQPWLHSWLLFALVASLHCTDQCLFFGRVGVQSFASRVCLEQQGGALQSSYVNGHRILMH